MTTTRKKQGRVYSDMIPFAYNFLLDTYGINGTPNIIISQYLNDCLARLEPFVDDDGNVFEYEYVDLPIMENGEAFYNRMADYRQSILTVTVIDNMNVPENAYRVLTFQKSKTKQ